MQPLTNSTSFEAFVTEQVNYLIGQTTDRLLQAVEGSIAEALRLFALDRLSLIAFPDPGHQKSRMLTVQRAGIPAMPPHWQQEDADCYALSISADSPGMEFGPAELRHSQCPQFQRLYQQGARWHNVTPLKVRGEHWGALAYCRFGEDCQPMETTHHVRLRLLAQIWAGCCSISTEFEQTKAAVMTPQDLGGLSLRQQEVLSLLASGMTAKACAEKLGLSRRTVESHKYRIMEQLNLETTADLFRFAISKGFVNC